MYSASITDDGSLDKPSEVAPFLGLGEESFPVLSADGSAAVERLRDGMDLLDAHWAGSGFQVSAEIAASVQYSS